MTHRSVAPAGIEWTAPARGLAIALAASALVWGITHVPQREFSPLGLTELTVGTSHYRVAAQDLGELERFSTAHFAAGRERAQRAVEAQLAAQLDAVFAAAGARVPEFVDWYYSLGGEYSRAAMAALAYANLAEPGYLAREAAERVLPEEAWAAGLDAADRSTRARLADVEQRIGAEWLDGLTGLLARNRVPAPLTDTASSGVPVLGLEPLIAAVAEPQVDALHDRVAVSTIAAGGAAAGPALWRAVAARTSTTAGRAAAGRLAGRSVARAGTAAAGGAAACAPGGPLAVGCALVAGAAAWLGTDWVLLRVDESLHRGELEAALHAALDALRAEVETNLRAAYQERLDARYDDLQSDIERVFVPAAQSRPLTPAAEAAPRVPIRSSPTD